MYSMLSVVSAEIPWEVRNSSREVRRKVPFIRKSNGIGVGEVRRLLTSVESW